MVRAVRGATTVLNNDKTEIWDATEEMLNEIIKTNNLNHEDLIRIIKTTYLRNVERLNNNKKIGDKENYAKKLKLALENKLSLTYPALVVRKELENLLNIDADLWIKEAESIEQFYEILGNDLPKELKNELENLKIRLQNK